MNDKKYHGHVVALGPDDEMEYFSGVGFDKNINEAQVYPSSNGARNAIRYYLRTTLKHPPKAMEQFKSITRVFTVRLQAVECV